MAFGESLAFISLLIPAWGALVAIGALIGASGISFWPVWIAGGVGAALGDWLSYWFGYKYKEHVAQMWPLSRYPEILLRGEAFVRKWGVPSIFIGRFFGPLRASVPLAAGIFEMPYWSFQFANCDFGVGLGGGAVAVRRRHRADRGMAVAHGLTPLRNRPAGFPPWVVSFAKASSSSRPRQERWYERRRQTPGSGKCRAEVNVPMGGHQPWN